MRLFSQHCSLLLWCCGAVVPHPYDNHACCAEQSLASILKKPGVRKKPYLVRGPGEVLTAARNITTDSLAPIFLTSAVTGDAKPQHRPATLNQRMSFFPVLSNNRCREAATAL